MKARAKQLSVARRPKRRYGMTFGLVASLLGTSCGGDVTTTTYGLECETGTLGCSCYGNWSCNYQLSCVDDLCVDNRARPASHEKQSNSTQSPADPLASVPNTDCVECIEEQCSKALEECYPETGCIALQACLLGCSLGEDSEASCGASCDEQAAAGARRKSASVTECARRSCTSCAK
jgi:hypothetical protein